MQEGVLPAKLAETETSVICQGPPSRKALAIPMKSSPCTRALLFGLLLVVGCRGNGQRDEVTPTVRNEGGVPAGQNGVGASTPQPPIPPSGEEREQVPAELRSFCRTHERREGAEPAGPEVEIETVRGFSGSPEGSLRCVVREWGEWERLASHASLTGSDAVTPETFERSMLLFVSLGMQPTRGSSIQIRSVADADDGFAAVVQFTRFEGSDPVSMALDFPFHIVRLERSVRRVRFIER